MSHNENFSRQNFFFFLTKENDLNFEDTMDDE